MRRQHILWLGWIGLLVVVLLAVGLLLRNKGIEGDLIALKNRRKAVEADHQKTKDELKKDLQRYVKVLRRFPWLLESGSGTAFLSRLSDVAADHLVEIRGVGPLERRKIGHIEKIGRRVKVSGSFSDILRVVENVEQNWGIIEGLRVEPPDQKGKNNGSENLQAQFSLVTVELSTSGRQRMRSVLASVPASKEANEVLAFPAPQGERRDPFLSSRAIQTKAASKKVKVVHPPFPKVRLSGFVKSLNKTLVIINNEILGEGERFDTVLVEQVTDDEVVLKSELTGKRIRLPLFTPIEW